MKKIIQIIILINCVFILKLNSQICPYSITFKPTGVLNCNLDKPYKLVFHDEFSGNSLDTEKWFTYYPYTSGQKDTCEFCRTHGLEGQIYRDSNISLDSGFLKIRAIRDTSTWYNATRYYSSGMIHSKTSFKYGKFVIRCKLPLGIGFWPAFWMWGSDEIDVFEYCSHDPSNQIMTLHKNCPNGNMQTSLEHQGINSSDGFHIYSVEWEPLYIYWKTDGQIVRKINRYSTIDGIEIECQTDISFGNYINNLFISNNYMSIIANLAINPLEGNFCKGTPPNSSTVLPQNFEIDYIRVYQKEPQEGLSDLCNDRQIIGTSTICDINEYTFKLNGLYSDESIWEVSNNLVIISQTPNSITVKATNYTLNQLNGEGFIKVKNVYEGCKDSILTTKITVGKPKIEVTINNPSCPIELLAQVFPNSYNGYWTINDGGNLSNNYSETAYIRGSQNNSTYYEATFRTSNYCGESTYLLSGYMPKCERDVFFKVNPNPTNNYLNIEFIDQNIKIDDIEYIKIINPILNTINSTLISTNLELLNYNNGIYYICIKLKNQVKIYYETFSILK